MSSRSLVLEEAVDLPQPLTRMCLYGKDELQISRVYPWKAYLESIFPRKALLTVPARKGLHRKMYPFMPFQVMVPVETLGTLITFEGSLIMRCRLRISIYLLLQMCCMAAIVASHHSTRKTMTLHADQTHWIIWVMDVRHDRSTHVCRGTHRGWEGIRGIRGAANEWIRL